MLNGEIPMPLLIGPDFQSQADALRELLTADASLRPFGVEILRASADETAIFVRARTRRRTLTVAEGRRWREASVPRLAVVFRQEIIADFYASDGSDFAPGRILSRPAAPACATVRAVAGTNVTSTGGGPRCD